MVGRGFQFDFLDSKWSSCHSHLFILGLILAYYTTLSAHDQGVKCKASKDVFSKYEHCGLHPDGVHGLDCFSAVNSHETKCVWRPGNHKSQKTYTLIIKQPIGHCFKYSNLTNLYQVIKIFSKKNMTAEVFENIDPKNCTKAVFSTSGNSLSRCGPPYNASFSRQSGKLNVDVSWQEGTKVIEFYSVRYKALESQLWNKSEQCQSRNRCTVENLNSSLIYIAQIQCVTNEKCSQCPWSKTYTVPSELTTPPVIVNLEDTDIAGKKGCRLLSLKWKFSAKDLYDGYYVTIAKVSGEAPVGGLNTTQPEIRLILSYSAYQLNISAVNNVSTSPAVSQTIPQREDDPSTAAGKLNITVHSNTSFTVYWKDDLIKTYVCYCVEWRRKGHKQSYMSFYENANNYRTLSPLPEPLEPYKRYSITLHTRPNKDTCNMKYINMSESTYGTTQFYFIEGSPVSAPTNISSDNETLNSVVLQWSPIPEEDIRGFLLGYTIHYAEHHHRGTSPERNVTVDPELDSYELRDLKKGTMYSIQISGFTQAGAGVRSAQKTFTTTNPGYFEINLTGVTIILAILATLLIFGSPVVKRAKVFLWPSIPHPGNSNAMQKIEGPCEMELLESINNLKVEEWDTSSLKLVEKEAVVLPNTLPSELPLLHDSHDEEDSSQMTCNWIQTGAEDATGDILPVYTSDAVSNIKQTNFQSSPFAFSSEYTTMDMFKQMMPQGISVDTAISQATESEPNDTHTTVVTSELHYVRQFSTSPISGSEDMSTIL